MTVALSPIAARRSGPLRGSVRVPGDKSISHRALIFGALAVGKTRITGLLEGEDVLHTADAMRALGASVERTGEGEWSVHGVGVAGFREPRAVLDFGNSATGCRLIMGAVAGCPVTATFDGDASLRKRPMRRILDPVERMGAHAVSAAEGGCLPITLKGARDPIPVVYRTPVASAQIKSAVLLAGLSAAGETTVIESEASRDHTERMLAHFGAELRVEAEGAGRRITLEGQPELHPATVAVPADPSSAAFPLVAALIVRGSDIVLTDVMTNPLRTGLITTLREMGADIAVIERRSEGGAGSRSCGSRNPIASPPWPTACAATASSSRSMAMISLCMGRASPRAEEPWSPIWITASPWPFWSWGLRAQSRWAWTTPPSSPPAFPAMCRCCAAWAATWADETAALHGSFIRSRSAARCVGRGRQGRHCRACTP